MKLYELTTIPHSLSPCTAWWEEGRRLRNEDDPGKKRRIEGRWFLILFIFLTILLYY